MASAVGGGSDVEVGFAKLQGEDFEYYMQSYSIMLGRNSKKSTVDVDLSSLGGGMNISRNHARIFYDFTRRRFSLEVLGKNGCFVLSDPKRMRGEDKPREQKPKASDNKPVMNE
ncbi:hypothetical protein F2Q70_00023825 [Brassica cretica]|uniref:FHA domain-containing protein n=1 Tax=Brassica cretica TaxID=69181 RepID=A0A8S9GKW4_BRACR|nr:hypothetical protein F2Q70_00023825 [Brassica cretica]